jgi:hypothetical protein
MIQWTAKTISPIYIQDSLEIYHAETKYIGEYDKQKIKKVFQ